MLNEGGIVAAERPHGLSPVRPGSVRLEPEAARAEASLSRDPSERLLLDALDSLTWLACGAGGFAFTVDERYVVDVTTLHCAPGQDRGEAATVAGGLRQLDAIDPFSPRRAVACRASVMSAAEVGGVEAYARSTHGQWLRRHGYGAPAVLYLWRAGRIMAGVTLLRGCEEPAFDAATLRRLRQLQPLLEDAFGFAAAPRGSAGDDGAPAAALTAREAEVARLVAGGARNADIAGALGVSEVTIKAHLTRIYAKLGVRSRTQLAVAMSDAD